MANKRKSEVLQDTTIFCGAVIKNIRNGKTFSFQTLYTESTGKKNPNRAYLLRDALVATGIIHVRRDKTLSLTKENYDSTKVVNDVLSWVASKDRKNSPKETIPSQEFFKLFIQLKALAEKEGVTITLNMK